MSGCYGSSGEDAYFERQLNEWLSQGECESCGEEWDETTLDSGICIYCKGVNDEE